MNHRRSAQMENRSEWRQHLSYDSRPKLSIRSLSSCMTHEGIEFNATGVTHRSWEKTGKWSQDRRKAEALLHGARLGGSLALAVL